MAFYRRDLPHWHPDGKPIFLTWRLHGSLPHGVALPENASEGQRFAILDRAMDRDCDGPRWLNDPRIAECVAKTLMAAEITWELCYLSAWVIMPNHLHALLDPRKPVPEVTRAIKSSSANAANWLLARRGQPFWQAESYDRWVRDRKEFDKIVRYIEWNPVRAGLAERVRDWGWSSAGSRTFTGRSGACPTAGH